MNEKELKELEANVKRKIGFILLGIGVVGFVGVFIFAILTNRDTGDTDTVEEQSFPAQEYTRVKETEWRYPTQNIGFNERFWEYEIVNFEVDYQERQDILDSGMLTLWPRFSEEDVIWIAGHNPGTFEYVAQYADIGSIIEVTTPEMYKGRYPDDTPDILRFEIVEILTTDVYAEDVFNTLNLSATDVYNSGIGESWLVLQHSGEEEGEIILYLGEFVEKEEGEFVSRIIEDDSYEEVTIQEGVEVDE